MKVLFSLLLLLSTYAHADHIYNWSGDCAKGCVGTATVQLVMAETYVPGKPFVDGFFEDPQFFVSLHYTDSSGSFSRDAYDTFGVGTLPLGEDFASLTWCFNACSDFAFREHADGTWSFKTDLPGPLASGSNGVFALLVPEPGTIFLLSLGMTGILFGRCHSRA